MNVMQDENYEDLAAEYQYQLVQMLDAALRKTPLAVDQRRLVCENFIFDMAVLHDQGEISVEQNESSPKLSFLTGNELNMPSDNFDLHDYAMGNVAEYFESNE